MEVRTFLSSSMLLYAVLVFVYKFSGVVIARHSLRSTRLLEIPSQIRGCNQIG